MTMAQTMTYLITGANRGIGRQLASDLLLRPSTTVIATVRKPTHETALSLKSLPTGPYSRLLVMHLDDEDEDAAYNTLPERLASQGISTVDIVIANAGTAPSFTTTLNTQIESVQACFATNAIGPLQLFHACWSFLQATDAADARRRKFVLVSSVSGSIGSLDHETYPNTAYAMSKAAANWLAKKLSVEFRDMGLKVGIVHPGWVQTEMGQTLADAVGVQEPPVTVEESSRQVLKLIDDLSFETTHGKFMAIGGQELQW
ncbi:hypothetical protein E4U12_004687 [Claviceps purpurea]|nr:hypothetical protein E4U12_004687 [Claviceps purpurea]